MKKLFTLLALAGLMMAQAPVAVFAQDAEMEVVADSAATDTTWLLQIRLQPTRPLLTQLLWLQPLLPKKLLKRPARS